MIIESIVSTIGADGKPNFAPMGVRVSAEGKLSLEVYHSSRTYRNLKSARSCVINMTGNALLFTRAALHAQPPPHKKSALAAGAILEEAEEALEFVTDAEHDMGGKSEFTGRVIGRKAGQPPELGFCRAPGAVIEALICVTRKGVLPDWEIKDQLRRSRVIVEKTGGADEQEAMRMIDEYWSANG
ncbi:MAG: DUF447 family protein [Nitrospinota bacterium]|nr:DUF447 family protein [Nitrospinota bacterium]